MVKHNTKHIKKMNTTKRTEQQTCENQRKEKQKEHHKLRTMNLNNTININ